MTAETSDPAARIDLAHVADFTIGALAVRPATREVMRDGQIEILEPRVMQVLVALARARGGVVSRDDLTQSCWEGRVVGEDAINRVISRLRRVGETIAQNGFRVETVTKVGYRLVAADGTATPADRAAPPAITRRWAIGGGAGLAAVIAAGGWWLWPRPAAPALPPEVAGLMQQAASQMRQANAEGNAQAIGLFRRALEISPDYADGWGYLAMSYAAAAHGRSPDHVADMIARAQSAAQHALSIDRDNPFARVALITLKPMIGNWLGGRTRHTRRSGWPAGCRGAVDRAGRRDGIDRPQRRGGPMPRPGGRDHPAGPGAAVLLRPAIVGWPIDWRKHSARSIKPFALFPIHFAVWFTRCYFLMYNSRAGEAVAMIEDTGARPPGIPDKEFRQPAALRKGNAIRAAKADIDAALAAVIEDSHGAAGAAENAIQFASAAGQIDDAFAIADAYFFGRGFTVGEVRFSTQQGSYTRSGDRRTFMLFLPPTAKMRSDPRFTALADEIGLSAYWKASGTKPDFRR